MNSSSPLFMFNRRLRPAAFAAAIGIDTKPVLRGSRSCITEDDRTPEQKKTHLWGVVARDRNLSGWGGASGGTSRCAWTCAPDVDRSRVLNWVRSRPDMQRVALVLINDYRPPAGTSHFHIYVCGPDHVAARY